MQLKNIQFIVWHTAAHGKDGQCFDTTIHEIDAWHRARGWSGVGYHFLIRRDGTIQSGRPIGSMGAHVEGLNDRSLGICFSGHGDLCVLTPQQLRSGVDLTIQLLKECSLIGSFLRGDHDGLTVMGHREVNSLVDLGIASKRTTKSCPGSKVDMAAIRDLVRNRLGPLRQELIDAMRPVYQLAKTLGISDGAMRHLNQFRWHKEVALSRTP